MSWHSVRDVDLTLTSVLKVIFVNVELSAVIRCPSRIEGDRDVVCAKGIVENRLAVCSVVGAK